MQSDAASDEWAKNDALIREARIRLPLCSLSIQQPESSHFSIRKNSSLLRHSESRGGGLFFFLVVVLGFDASA